jgi:uncharacterized OB-fold protein
VTAQTTSALPAVREGLFTLEPPALSAGRCASCGARHFPARAVCPECQRDDVEVVALSTTGVVHTFTIIRVPPPGYVGDAPYALGVVELPEGLRVTTTLLADDLDAIAIGDACTFELLALGEEEARVLSFAHRVGTGGR